MIKRSLFKLISILYMVTIANLYFCYSQDNLHIKQIREEIDSIYKEIYHPLDEFIINTMDGKEIFKWKRFRTNVNGVVKFTCSEQMDIGKREGIEGKICFKDGLKHGIAKIRACETGTNYEMNYYMGLLNGYCKVFYNSAKYFNGKREEINITFYETNFINGNGIWKDFYRTGNLKETGEYKSGKKEGEWLYYSENNKLYLKRYFENGIQVDSVKIKNTQTEILEIKLDD